jgi:FkbM family methyltransferase
MSRTTILPLTVAFLLGFVIASLASYGGRNSACLFSGELAGPSPSNGRVRTAADQATDMELPEPPANNAHPLKKATGVIPPCPTAAAPVAASGDAPPGDEANPVGPSPVDDAGAEAAVMRRETISGDAVASGKSLPAAQCPSSEHIQSVFSHFIDIDFIEFVQTSCSDPVNSKVLDVGLYHGGEVVSLSQRGFSVVGFEPNPNRYAQCVQFAKSRLNEQQLARLELHNAAVSNSDTPLYFQLAGVDSHAYVLGPGEPTKIKTVIVNATPAAEILKKHPHLYFAKIDTQGFDTRIVDSLLDALEGVTSPGATAQPSVRTNTDRTGDRISAPSIEYIQFEYSPFLESSRSQRTAADHKRFFKRLIAAGYDVFMGAVVQPWNKGRAPSRYRRTPLSMIAPDRDVPTCVDEFVDYLHASKRRPIIHGKTSTEHGSWVDILAVRRSARIANHRHTGWVLARKM